MTPLFICFRAEVRWEPLSRVSTKVGTSAAHFYTPDGIYEGENGSTRSLGGGRRGNLLRGQIGVPRGFWRCKVRILNGSGGVFSWFGFGHFSGRSEILKPIDFRGKVRIARKTILGILDEICNVLIFGKN